MNATSVLVMILILSFAADRLAKAAMFGLSLIPRWARAFPDPALIEDKGERARAARRALAAYTIIIGALAAAALLVFPEIRMLKMLVGPRTHPVIDVMVSAIVVMGGSDLVGRIVQLSGLAEGGAAPAGGGRAPVEVVGRLELGDGPRRMTSGEREPTP